jgi:hypothetical protein
VIGAALKTWLSARGPIREAVGERIYPEERPRNSGLPAITYQVTGQRNQTCYDGPSWPAIARVQIDVWGASYQETQALRRAVAGDQASPGLDGYSGPVGDLLISAVLTNDLDAQIETTRHALLEFLIKYKPRA